MNYRNIMGIQMKQNVIEKVPRNSGIELLKVIAMILIAISHAVPVYGDYKAISFVNIDVCTADFSVIIMAMFRYLGTIGNDIFIVSSAWFLIESNKIRKEKVINIIFNSFAISVTILIILKALGIDIPKADFKSAFTPIMMNLNWFVTCYLVLYLIHPLLNMTIEKMQQKELLKLNIIFFMVYVILSIYKSSIFFRTALLEMIIIYYNVAYIKLYRKKFCNDSKSNLYYLIIGIAALISEILLMNGIGLHATNGKLYLTKFNGMINPLICMIAITAFNIFRNINLKNKIVNYISSLSILFYMIHENLLLANYVRPKFYQKFFVYGYRVGWVLIEAVLLIAFGITFAMIYKESIGKITNILSVKTKEIIEKVYNKIEKKIIKLN